MNRERNMVAEEAYGLAKGAVDRRPSAKRHYASLVRSLRCGTCPGIRITVSQSVMLMADTWAVPLELTGPVPRGLRRSRASFATVFPSFQEAALKNLKLRPQGSARRGARR